MRSIWLCFVIRHVLNFFPNLKGYLEASYNRRLWFCLEVFLPSQASWMCTMSPTSRESCFSPRPTKFHLTKKTKKKKHWLTVQPTRLFHRIDQTINQFIWITVRSLINNDRCLQQEQQLSGSTAAARTTVRRRTGNQLVTESVAVKPASSVCTTSQDCFAPSFLLMVLVTKQAVTQL